MTVDGVLICAAVALVVLIAGVFWMIRVVSKTKPKLAAIVTGCMLMFIMGDVYIIIGTAMVAIMSRQM